MKKLILLTIVAAGVIACNSNKGGGAEAVNPMANLTAWLDSIDNLGDITAEQMSAIEAEYDAATAGMDASTLDEAGKSEWDAIASRWETFKANNAVTTDGDTTDGGAAATVTEEHAKEIYTEFLGDVKMADANDYSFMTAENALAVYQGFAAKAKAHKEDYSSDDWNFVKAMYEKIDARKNEIEKDLPGADNRKIAALKIKLAPMFKLGKIGAKLDEKVEQKEAEAAE